jgi:class 3 adenylate cyclase
MLGIKGCMPAYFQVDKDGGHLISWGGNVESYGIHKLQHGKPITEQLDFLEGLLPLDQSPLYLSCVKTEEGPSFDIHIFSGDQCDWILLMNADQEEARNTLLQQKTNELNLLRKKMSDVWHHIESGDQTSEVDLKTFGLPEGEGQREVSVLRTNLQDFSSCIEKKSPKQVFKTFEKHLRMIVLPIIDAGGIVTSIFGTATTAVFGILPAVSNPSDQALTAAMRILESIKELNKVRKKHGKDTFNIGVGISSGSVVLGFRGDKNRSFNVVGYPVDEADKLEGQARPFEIIIDSNTLKKIKLEDYRKRFSNFVPNPTAKDFSHQTFSFVMET